MASKYRKKFELPEGFYGILEDYTREILRDQPLDILEYSYLYFKHMNEGTLDQFDYPAKGDSIPPPKLKDEEIAYLQQQQQEEQLQQNNIGYNNSATTGGGASRSHGGPQM